MTSKKAIEPTGDCFEAAMNFLMEAEVVHYPDDYRLIHGNVAKLRQDEAVNHAWIAEEHKIVHEVSGGKHDVYCKETYYKRHQITNVRIYTVDEALFLSIRHRHSGPWD